MPIYTAILRLEGLLLGGAGIAHLVYVAGFLDWSAFPLQMSLGATAFGVFYTLFGGTMLAGSARWLLPALVVNILGFSAVMIAGETSPLAPIDPYLSIVDFVSIPVLAWLLFRRTSLAA